VARQKYKMQHNYKIGSYWAKTSDIENIQRGEWQPVYYNGTGFELCENDEQEGDYYFDEIAERINCPHQPVRGDT
jgi:hypothetical protein